MEGKVQIKVQEDGAREMALGVHTALVEDMRVVPSTRCHVAHTDTHTQIYNLEINLFFFFRYKRTTGKSQ